MNTDFQCTDHLKITYNVITNSNFGEATVPSSSVTKNSASQLHQSYIYHAKIINLAFLANKYEFTESVIISTVKLSTISMLLAFIL